MRQRIITAVILAVLLLTSIVYLPTSLLLLGLGLLFLGGFWEWAGFAGHKFGLRRLPFVGTGLLGLAATYVYIFEMGGSPLPILVAAALWWVIALLWVMRYPTPVPGYVVRAAAFVVLIPAWLGLALLVSRETLGGLWLLSAFFLVWAADTGAYFCGKAFGRHKLAPSVSPGKTWEGVVGGVVLAVIVAVVLALQLGIDPVVFGAVAVPIALASVVGDLIVSLFKRNAGLKDSGRLFPGHGGILDRIDSVCAAAPLLALGLILAGLKAAT
ncbi:MAG: phosphatidate cytidylyltransferase [Gammaproteobacteria bacterium]